MLTLREEILNLLESPELLEYLLSNPERLCEFDYANIIAGAPIGLAEKRALLEKLKTVRSCAESRIKLPIILPLWIPQRRLLRTAATKPRCPLCCADAALTALLTALIMRHLRSLREGQSANMFRSAVTAIGVICTGR